MPAVPASPHVLLIDDDAGVREALGFSLEEAGYEVSLAASGQEGLARFVERRPDIVLTDLRMPGQSGLDVLRAVKQQDPALPVVVFTAYGSVDTAVAAMREGAADFITKPVSRDALVLTLARVLRQRALEEENRNLRARIDAREGAGEILAVSSAMRTTLDLIDRVAGSDATVLVTGESGTGKELAARRLHERSTRRGGPFVALNCSALPKDLLEAELFGFEKGAFTGASRRRTGRFVEASGGTLFLDEIGDLPLELQAKLLRVLQESTVDVVGGGSVDVDVRIVAATHRDLRAMVAAGTFREDLFFRLHVVPIELPPLRARPEDIAPLFVHFLARAATRAGRPPLRTSPAFLDELARRRWPGNVREVENLATRLAVTAPGDLLDVSALQPSDGGGLPPAGEPLAGAGGVVEAEAVLRLPEGGVSLEELERAAVVAALSVAQGNQSRAARFLRIPRHVLLYRVDKYAVQPGEWQAGHGRAEAPIRSSKPHDDGRSDRRGAEGRAREEEPT